MAKKVVQFRRLKNGDPEKLKILAEDIAAQNDRGTFRFAVLVIILAAATFSATFLLLQ